MHCHSHEHHNSNVLKNSLSQRAIWVSAIANFFILCVKYYAWKKTNSLSYLSGLLEISFDTLLSFMNIFFLKISSRPANSGYRFGFGKVEALGAIVQVLVVLYGSIWLAVESIQRLAAPEKILNQMLGIYLIIFSTCITLGVVFVQQHALKRTESLLVSSDAVHALGHVALNLGILISLGLSFWGAAPWFDALFGCCVALYMVWGSLKVGRSSLQSLLDAELPLQKRKKIKATILAVPGVEGVHQLRTRTSGRVIFIQGHLEMCESMTFRQAHDLAHVVELQIQNIFPHAQVLLHQDIGGEEEHVKEY